jgi:hypothetical protein
VAELKRGSTLWPAVQTFISPEWVSHFVTFAQAFTAFDEVTILAALAQGRVEATRAFSDALEPEEPDELEELWTQVLEQVQLQMPRSTFDSWLKDSYLIAWEGERFTVVVKNHQAKEWLENRLSVTIRRTLSRLVKELKGRPLARLELYFIVETERLK